MAKSILYDLCKKGKSEVKGAYWKIKKGKAPIKRLEFVYHLADHCNLNCRCCDHFSPIAEEKLADLDSFRKDVRRLAELCNGVCDHISLQGGEPLLHPNAIDFAIVARESFQEGNIRFLTNGLLLEKQPDSFWEICAQYHIGLFVTKYPISFDYEKMQKKAESFGVDFYIYNNFETVKTTYFIPLDVRGGQKPLDSYCKCFHANTCIMLKDGRLYPCTVAPNIEHFNKYFHQNLFLSEADSINIYEAGTFEEIAEFLSRPIPFCRYCNVKERKQGLQWGQSKRSISEWVKEEG